MINNVISETESAPSWSQPDATPLLEENYGDEKKGHSFFGFCCDSRRATIIVNILSLILFIACLLAALLPGRITMDGQNVVAMIFNLFFTCVIIYGAYKWVYTFVLIGLLWEVFILIFWIVGASSSIKGTDWSHESSNAKSSTIAFVVISIIWQFIVIYAEVIFVWECKRGIMTAETYTREEQSCFCVSKKQNASTSIAKDEKEASQVV